MPNDPLPGGTTERLPHLWLGALLAMPAICLVVTFVLPLLPRHPPFDCTFQDIEMSLLVEPLRTLGAEQPLGPDGRLDVYLLLRRESTRGKLAKGEIVKACNGPSWEEIEAGDYARLPYQRRKGRFSPRAQPPVPVLWEPRSPQRRYSFVAFSDGTCRLCDEAEADAIFRGDPGQE
jgi:hypothetical protein